MRQIPGREICSTLLQKSGEHWKCLGTSWNWIRENKYEAVGMQKGDHGCNGFEEQVNWHEGKAPDKWVIDLWVQFRD